MPTVFYTVDGVPKDEHPEEEIEAITAYLLETTQPPEDAQVQMEVERKSQPGAGQADWRGEKY